MKFGKKQNKLDPKASKCIMIGYSANHAGDTYRLYNTETKKVVNSRNIKWANWHGATKPTEGMIEFHSDDTGIDEVDTRSHINFKDDVDEASKTGENNDQGISKSSTRLSRELKKLEWNKAPNENKKE